MERHEWIKVHLMCGTKTNIVTSIEITDQHSGDWPQFKGLVDTTARNFMMNEVSADKAYLSSDRRSGKRRLRPSLPEYELQDSCLRFFLS